MRWPVLAAALAVFTAPDVALAQMSHEHHQGRETCADLTFACAGTVTPAFDGALWVAARVNNQIFVAKSLDHGRSFSPPVVITPDAVTLDGGPDARPKIVVDRAGRVIVACSTFRDKKFNGQLFYTRSIDGGKTFAAPQPITADAESQRFIAVAIDSDGSIFSAWLDKRNRAAAKEKGETYAGAGLAGPGGDFSGRKYRARQHLRMLPHRYCLRASRAPCHPVSQSFRHVRTGSRGHDVRGAGQAWAGLSCQR